MLVCFLMSKHRVRGQVTDTSCDDVRAAFEDEHPRNMVDASDAYALSVFPFGRDDKKTFRVSTEWVIPPEVFKTWNYTTSSYTSCQTSRSGFRCLAAQEPVLDRVFPKPAANWAGCGTPIVPCGRQLGYGLDTFLRVARH